MRAEAGGKVNLGLRVRARDRSGLHPLRSLAQSIDWADLLTLDEAEEDAFTVQGLPVPDDEGNLAWRALEAVRALAARPAPAGLVLDKRIPVAAGLAGGSADAAAVLALAAERYHIESERRDALAPALGADVPFCLVGGVALVEGHGERVTPLPFAGDFVLAVVVPPFAVATTAAYRRWDDLDGPQGPAVDARDLPVSLRPHAPLANDLVPAAVSLVPDLGDWMADLRYRWGQPVLMSGSGPSLFGFFATVSEAEEAAAVPGARAARACLPIPPGGPVPSGTLP